MDYVTRQFIHLTKKFRKELRLATSKLSVALEKQAKAISESAQASKREQSPPPEVIVQNHFPESINVHQDAQAARYEKNYRLVTVFIAALTLGAIVVYSVLVFRQYEQMIVATRAAQDAANSARDGLTETRKQFATSERAWIGVTRPTRIYPEEGGVNLQVLLVNTGKTPGFISTTRKNSKLLDGRLTELPKNPEYPQIPPIGTTVMFPGDRVSH